MGKVRKFHLLLFCYGYRGMRGLTRFSPQVIHYGVDNRGWREMGSMGKATASHLQASGSFNSNARAVRFPVLKVQGHGGRGRHTC